MVENGKYIQIQYTGTFDNGEVFDTNVNLDPLEFLVGSGNIISGIEKGVMGMNINDEKDLIIKPEDGYGDYNDAFVLNVPLHEMQSNFNPEPGMIISIQMDDGNLAPARITDVTNDSATLDLNHPLAGKILHFSIKILAVNEEPQMDQKCSCCSEETCEDDDCSC